MVSQIWGEIVDGENLVHFIRKKLYNHNQQSHTKKIQQKNWVSSKVNTLVWRANLERILTHDALAQRDVPIQRTLCPCCGDHEESIDRMFTSCRFINFIWVAISTWMKITPIFAFSFEDLLRISDLATSNKGKKKNNPCDHIYHTLECMQIEERHGI